MLNQKFPKNSRVNLIFNTRIDSSVDKGKKGYFVVSFDDTKVSDCIGIDFKVRLQASIRKSFESQQEFEKFVDEHANESNPFHVHITNINKKIETPSMRKARLIRELKAAGLTADDLK